MNTARNRIQTAPNRWELAHGRRKEAQGEVASCHLYLSPSNQLLLDPARENSRSQRFKA